MTPTRHLRAAAPAPGVRLPTVEEIDAISADLLPAVLVELAALQARAALRLRTERRAVGDARGAAPDDAGALLTAAEAAALLRVPVQWLRRRSELPFVVPLAAGTVRYHRARLLRWIEAHLAPLASGTEVR